MINDNENRSGLYRQKKSRNVTLESVSWWSSLRITINYSQLKGWDEQLRNPQQLLHCRDERNVQETVGDKKQIHNKQEFCQTTLKKISYLFLKLQVTLKETDNIWLSFCDEWIIFRSVSALKP